MGLFKKRFNKQQQAMKTPPSMVEERNKEETDEMIAVPAYIDVSPADIERVSVIAASLAAEHYPESRFVIKKIKQRNPEMVLVSLIATAVGAEAHPHSQFVIRKITKK
ncbi:MULTISPECIES: hypothetical protein [unclassified Enterococcus]|uniref:hypothetical protein n=1 Tax=unclassified Enterococcus TaxID=2608891 RepID=UPI001F60A537|nr:hypothetical protein [Enterococcus sp. DIV1271a]